MKNCTKYYGWLFLFNILLSDAVYSQVCQVTISSHKAGRSGATVVLDYDKTAKLNAITGISSQKDMAGSVPLSTLNGLQLPVGGLLQVNVSGNGTGGFIITMNDTKDFETGTTHKVTINKEGKIIRYDNYAPNSIQLCDYIYNNSGDLTLIKWTSKSLEENGVTAEATLIPSFDVSKLEVLSGGGPMTAFARMPWQFIPMTNTHLLTSYVMTQTFHVPKMDDRKIITTRSLSYTYDKAGRVAAVAMSTGKGGSPNVYDFSYGSCK